MLLLYGFCTIDKELGFPGKWALVPVLGATLIIKAGSKAWINHTILSNKITVWFGLISFPLYLWHWPILSFARIIESEAPSQNIRLAAVALSIVLAWITYKFVERPIRFGKRSKAKLELIVLILAMATIGYIGYNTFKRNGLSFRLKNLTNDSLLFKRKDVDPSSSSFLLSLKWYQGKEDWLFLGNAIDRTVSKLKLDITPKKSEIEDMNKIFSAIADVGAKSNIKIFLMIGPSKSSIYPNYLPDYLVPSKKKYIDFFLDNLKSIPNLTIYNPTNDMLKAKNSEGILYYRTDTHWNDKGAFLAYSGFLKLLNLPLLQVKFTQSSKTPSGDLIDISGLKNFPLHKGDKYNLVWHEKPLFVEEKALNEPKSTFGIPSISTNAKPISNEHVWVIGDSFTEALKQYFNATFYKVRYVGHWKDHLKTLPEEIKKSKVKPNLIVIVRVERSF